jgi:hypothetical protein
VRIFSFCADQNLLCRSDSQALTALSTAGVDDLAAAPSAHTGQKAMNFLALTLLRLKSSLHGFIPPSKMLHTPKAA